MSLEASMRGFVAAIIFGAGAHIGWAIIGAVINFLAQAMN